MKKVKLSTEQTQKMTEEYQRIAEMAKEQETAHRLWLQNLITTTSDEAIINTWPYDSAGNTRHKLLASLSEFKLGSVMVEPHIRTIKDEPTLSIIWEYPDALCDFCELPNAPEAFKRILAGGIVVEDKPMWTKEN